MPGLSATLQFNLEYYYTKSSIQYSTSPDVYIQEKDENPRGFKWNISHARVLFITGRRKQALVAVDPLKHAPSWTLGRMATPNATRPGHDWHGQCLAFSSGTSSYGALP